MRYSKAIQFLYELQWFGLKLGLENTRRLAALAGNPHEQLRFIHVAGTNGKGSTCAMLESIYRAAGLRVGLFTSPHLVNFSERIQVNRQPVSEAQVVELVERTQAWLQDFPQDHSPTFFEVVTVMALRHFADQQCDLVVWETGMGGRLDATNIVTPLASAITNIQFDHQQWLGDTLAKIAAEKAGIIKPHVPAFTTADEPEALAVIRDTARRLAAPLAEVTPAGAVAAPLDTMCLPLLGAHQRLNAALALAVVRALAPAIPVSEAALREGLSRVYWPGRLQVIEGACGQVNVLDGAHNPAGVAALRAAWEQHFAGIRPTLIIGVLRDKDWPTMFQTLVPLAQAVYLVPVASARTAAPMDLMAVCQRIRPPVRTVACGSLREALVLTEKDKNRLLAGSLYLVGEALERLGALAAPPLNERALNEWQARPGH
jgi:dihydrofolate synthase/folylpolyglutamate synthase